MNYHKECLRLIGCGNLNLIKIAYEFAARHPKEFIQFVAPNMIENNKKIKICLKDSQGIILPEFEIDEKLMQKCKETVIQSLNKNNKIVAIREVRNLINFDICTAKAFVEAVQSGNL